MAFIRELNDAEMRIYRPIVKVAAQSLGVEPNSARTLGRNPELIVAFSLLTKAALPDKNAKVPLFGAFVMLVRLAWRRLWTRPRGEIDDSLRSLVSLAVSLSAGCRYCQAHTSGTAGRQGVSTEKIEAILNYQDSPLYTPAERAALDLAFAAGLHPNDARREHFDRLREFFDEDQIHSIVSVIALFGFLNRWNDTMGTTLEAPAVAFAEEHLAAQAGWEIGKHG